MAKKRLQRTTILLFVCIISSFLFSLSVCSDHVRNKPFGVNSQASGGRTQTKPNKPSILPTIQSTSNGANKMQEQTKDDEDEEEARTDKGKLETGSLSPPASSSPSQAKSEASLQASNHDSIVKQLMNNTQEINEHYQTKHPGSAVEGNNNAKEGVDDIRQEVPSRTLDVMTQPQVPQPPETPEAEGGEDHAEGVHHKAEESREDLVDVSAKTLEGFLEIDIENELKTASKKEGIVNEKQRDEEGERIEGAISDGDEQSTTENDATENVQYKAELKSDEENRKQNIQDVEKTENIIEKEPSKKNEESEKSGEKKDDVKIEDGAKDKEITDGEKDKEITDVAKDEEITDVAKDKEITDVANDNEITDVANDKEITDVANDKEITDVATDKQITDVAKDKEVTDGAKDKAVTDGAKDKEITDVANDKEITDVAKDSEIKDGKNDTVIASDKDAKDEEEKEKSGEKKEEMEDEIDPMPSFDEWKQLKLELNEQEKMQANYDGQLPPAPRHNAKLSNKNYASVDCGAKIVDSNKESQRTASAILSSNRDEYMLNPCTAKIWFTVEMCEPIQVKKVEIANLELFSSTPESFKVFTSDRHPTGYWREVGLFYARDERSLQTFPIHDETLFTKFIKVEFLTFFGKEHYCPISLLRVFGTSMEEEIDSESGHQIDPSPSEVLPPHPTVTPEDTSTDGIFDSVIKIVAKAFRGEIKDPKDGDEFSEPCFVEARIPVVPENVQKDELLACFPYSNSVPRSHINALKNTHDMKQNMLNETNTADTTEEEIKISKTSTEANHRAEETSDNKTIRDSMVSPSPPIPIWSIGCKSCQYSFRPHYADVFHECHLVVLSIFEFGVYFCCHDAPIRTLVYDGAIGLRASTISKCNSSSTSATSANISSKVIEASAVSVSASMQSINVQPGVSVGNIHLESTPGVGVPSGIDPSEETPPLPGNTSYSEASHDKMESDIQNKNTTLVKETDKEKPSNIQNVEELTNEDMNSKTKLVNGMVQEEPANKDQDTINTETSSDGIQDSPTVIDINEKDPVTDSHSDIQVNSLKVDKKDDQIKVETQPIEAEPVKEPASETSRNDDSVKPSGDTAATDIKEQSPSDTTDSITSKSSEAASVSSSKPNGGNGQENSTNGKSKTVPGDGFPATSNQFGIGIPKESVLMRLNNRIKSLEVNLSLSSLYLQELSQRYKKQMDDMRRNYDTKVAKLYEKAEEKEQIQTEQVTKLEGEIEKLKTSLHDMNVTLEDARKQTLEPHFVLMLVQVVTVCFLLIRACPRRQVIQAVPTVPQGKSLKDQAKGHGRRNSYSGRINHEGVTKPPHEGAKLEGGYQDVLIIEPPTPIKQANLQTNENMKNRRLKNKQKQKNNLKSSSASNLKKDNKKLKTSAISSAGLLFGDAAEKEASNKQNGTCNGKLNRPKSTENLTRVEDVPHTMGQDRHKFCNGY